jgi:hypothetical protein
MITASRPEEQGIQEWLNKPLGLTSVAAVDMNMLLSNTQDEQASIARVWFTPTLLLTE